jgi:TPR repeat protein
MKTISPMFFTIIWATVFVNVAPAQAPLSGALKMSFSDVVATKQRAEAGDPQAQLSLGDTLAFNFKAADALVWYRKSAEQDLVEAKSRAGEMLLFGRPGIPASQCVAQDPVEGIRWTFEAATNFNAKACLNMSKCFQNGIGVNVNLVEAYAWLELYNEKDTIVGQGLLNQLALQLDTQGIQKAQTMASEFQSGHWPLISPRKIAEGDLRLKLEGIMFGGKVPLASINGRSLAEGESADVSLKKDHLKIKCIQIQKDSVLILIEGENESRRLQLK